MCAKAWPRCANAAHPNTPEVVLLLLDFHSAGLARAWASVCVLAGVFMANVHAAPSDMAERTRACTHCHGEQGKAGPDGYYPRLAGKPAGYLYNQLQNFKQRRRHYDLMTRLIDPLSDDYLRDMAMYFSSLKVPYPPAALTSAGMAPEVLLRGKTLVTQGDARLGLPACSSCHGHTLTGVQPNVPGLVGLPLDYLNSQLGAWQSGQRQAHAPDCMAQVVKRLSPADLMAVTHYLARQTPAGVGAPLSEEVHRSLVAKQDTAWRCGSAAGVSAEKAKP